MADEKGVRAGQQLPEPQLLPSSSGKPKYVGEVIGVVRLTLYWELSDGTLIRIAGDPRIERRIIEAELGQAGRELISEGRLLAEFPPDAVPAERHEVRVDDRRRLSPASNGGAASEPGSGQRQSDNGSASTREHSGS